MDTTERWLRLTAAAPEVDEEPDVWVNIVQVVTITVRRDMGTNVPYTVLRHGPDTDGGSYEILVAETPDQILAGVSVRYPVAHERVGRTEEAFRRTLREGGGGQ